MKEDSDRKHPKYHNQSLMALTMVNQAEQTKKVIEPFECDVQPVSQSDSKLYVFKLPLSAEISALVTSITTRFSNFVIHSEEDQLGAQIILEGLQFPGLRAKVAKIIDYFIFCCSKGLKFGKLSEVYNVVVITIKKQIIDQQSLITVSNPYSQLMKTQMRETYFNLILNPIQQQVKNALKNRKGHRDIYLRNPYLNYNSPTVIDMQIHKKIYDLFISPDNKYYSRCKEVFLISLQKIDEKIELRRLGINITDRKASNPSNLVKIIVQQTQSLINSMKNAYKQGNSQQITYLQSLLGSQTAEAITFYTIQEVLCLYRLKNLKDIYCSAISQQCKTFNKQVQFLNENITDDECFQHLTLKQKYRLPDEKRPYFSAIQRLKLVQHSLSLREALLVIQQTFSDVKTDCFTSSKGKLQLSGMDEMLPVIIFITVRAAIKNFPIYVAMIGDYISHREVFELQERTMTAFYAAIQDINRGWFDSSEDKTK